jgi:spermidine synthase
MYYEDAYAWFINRYAQDLNKESLDVIIMDARDPESEVPFAEALYDNIAFMKSFYDSLSKSGVLVMQLGQSPNVRDPDETQSKHKNRSKVMRLLEDVGFKSIHTYEEGHCGFGDAWSFVVSFKSYIARQRWFRNSAEVDLEILKRVKRTKTGKSPLL